MITANINKGAKRLSKGMGEAVGKRTILRKKENGKVETWAEVASRVALGNVSLEPRKDKQQEEYDKLNYHISRATTLMSGRHLQHGDELQPTRPGEIITNCSTATSSFLLYYLLLNGSGVGRAYDDSLMIVDWDNMPIVECVLSSTHKDYNYKMDTTVDQAVHKYNNTWSKYDDIGNLIFNPKANAKVFYYLVPDSREGWAKCVEIIECMANRGIYANRRLILDFSNVRPEGAPIKGMQGRPSSGPRPMMEALRKVQSIKGAGMPKWKQTMFIDHYLAECVLVGGARRAARISTKIWTDPGAIEFAHIKDTGELWSSNNSLAVTKEFWKQESPYSQRLLDEAVSTSYRTKSGEPGFINVDKLTRNERGREKFLESFVLGSQRYALSENAKMLQKETFTNSSTMLYPMITNPCVTKDTWVETSEGPAQVGDLINCPFKANVNGKFYDSLKGFWSTGVKEVFRINTKRGYELKVTGIHEILVETSRKQKLYRPPEYMGGYNVQHEWIEAKDLKPGDKIVLNDLSAQSYTRDTDSFNRGWLLGEMLGDGGYNPEKYRGYVRFWGDSADRMSKLAIDMVNKLIRKEGHSGTREIGGSVYEGIYTVASSFLNDLAEDFIEPGTKNLIKLAEIGSHSLISGFIRGLFDADGSVQGSTKKGRSIRLAQSNLHNLKVVQRMLLRLGIACSIYKRREAGETMLPDTNGELAPYKTKTQYELVISKTNIDRYAEVVGFYEPEKVIALQELIAEPSRAIYKERFTTEFIGKESIGEEEVYDCTVEEVHRFDANGIIAHNCGEISLWVGGGYCVIADVVPYHAESLDEAEDAFRVTARALVRANLMDFVYNDEVKRTNRIGVGMTGIHEFAWKFFKIGFRDMLTMEDSDTPVGKENKEIQKRVEEFWHTLSRFNNAVIDEATKYSKELGVVVPHTMLTIKPAGTTSKLFGLTEGAHLPAMKEYIRWVQFKNSDPLVEKYKKKGYQTRELEKYSGMTIVGFPTVPEICSLGMGDRLVTAPDATPEEQYKYLRLLEQYYLHGIDPKTGKIRTTKSRANQVSYSLKYYESKVSEDQLKQLILENQPTVTCCSIMPSEEKTIYEYLPEQAVTKLEFENILSQIKEDEEDVEEDINKAHLDCSTGACPIDFKA